MERAFGTLKLQWRMILKKIKQKTTPLKKTVIVACVLHDIYVERVDPHDTVYSNNI